MMPEIHTYTQTHIIIDSHRRMYGYGVGREKLVRENDRKVYYSVHA